MSRMVILGSTGSIGVSTLDVIARNAAGFEVLALTANGNVDLMAEQCARFRPRYAVMADEAAADRLSGMLRQTAPDVTVLSGQEGLVTVAGLDEADAVVAAIVGAAGLFPALEAAKKGKRVLLANKESLVMSGHLFMQAVKDNNATLLPVDSEHNAILQCLPEGYLPGDRPEGVRRIVLTASGGPFRTLPVRDLAAVTPEQAVRHPNWDMGRKISVDSATMMNKGLEVIEAAWLFGMPRDSIDVIVHPQSVVHSLVEYDDGSVLAQMGTPDMRVPISYALGWPKRLASGANSLDLLAMGELRFEAADTTRYPCLQLAFDAWDAGGTAPAVLNAANEVAVEAFLQKRIPFTGIPEMTHAVLAECGVAEADSLDAVVRADAAARAAAQRRLGEDREVVAG